MIKRLFLIIFCLCFVMQTVHAGIVKPVFKQLKDPNLDGEDNEPSTTSIQITPDGKKMFLMDHLGDSGATDGHSIFIYDLTTAFDISTMDVANRTIVDTTGLGDDLAFVQGNKDIEFSNDGKKLFLFTASGTAQFHNLATPYDVASISASTLIPDDGLNYRTAYSEADITLLNGVTFSNDGTKMYLNDGSKNTTDVTQVNLSTPYDPSSGTFAFTLNTEDIPDLTANRFTMDIAFDDDGTRFYISEGINNGTGYVTSIFVYKLSDPFELNSATYVGEYEIDGNGQNVSAYGWTFGNNGMKAYIATEDANAHGDDIIYEYDLTCPYGIVICENEVATVVSAQAEIAKNVIYQNSSNIFKRFDWLRRNEERITLNNHNIKLNINNPILTKLKTNLENSLKNKLDQSFTDIENSQASLKNKKPIPNKKNWSYWSHGDISIGRQGDTLSLKPKEIKARGLMFGADGFLYGTSIGVKAIVRFDSQGVPTPIVEGVNCNDLVVLGNGTIFFTDHVEGKIWSVSSEGKLLEVAAGITFPNGLIAWPNQKQLVVADMRGRYLWNFCITADGQLKHQQPYSTMQLSVGKTESGADGMTVDKVGRVYVCTEQGVQIFDTQGRLSGVLAKPQRAFLSNITLGGPELNYLYATSTDKVYRRKLNTNGVRLAK